MELANLERIFGALQATEVRYLVVGGLAVITHGYLRTTDDIDLVIALDPENVTKAMAALTDLGYRPKIPVSASDFADAGLRRRSDRGKGDGCLSALQRSVSLRTNRRVRFRAI